MSRRATPHHTTPPLQHHHTTPQYHTILPLQHHNTTPHATATPQNHTTANTKLHRTRCDIIGGLDRTLCNIQHECHKAWRLFRANISQKSALQSFCIAKLSGTLTFEKFYHLLSPPDCKQNRCHRPHLRQPYIPSKEPRIPLKEPYIPHMQTKQNMKAPSPSPAEETLFGHAYMGLF